jgi:hypothetical protein
VFLSFSPIIIRDLQQKQVDHWKEHEILV